MRPERKRFFIARVLRFSFGLLSLIVVSACAPAKKAEPLPKIPEEARQTAGLFAPPPPLEPVLEPIAPTGPVLTLTAEPAKREGWDKQFEVTEP